MVSLGIIGFHFLRKAPVFDAEEGKFYAEVVLYLSFLFGVIICGLHAYVFIRNRNILKELDKIIEMSSYNNFSPVQSLERLSTIGDKIGQLYKNISLVSEKRALKISSLHNLTGFLLNNLSLPVLVTDVRGIVTATSKQFREKYPDYEEIVSGSILSFLPDIKFQQIMERFEENYSSVEMKQGRNDITIYPIRNREYEIANYVFVIGKGTLVQEEVTRDNAAARQTAQARKGLFSKLLGKRYRK